MVGVVHSEVLDKVGMVNATALDTLKLLLNGRYLQNTVYTTYMCDIVHE